MTTWQLQGAKNRFSAVVDAALTGEPQEVTRQGKPVVMVIAVEEYAQLCQTEQTSTPNFIEHLLAIPKGGPDDLFERLTFKPRDLEL